MNLSFEPLALRLFAALGNGVLQGLIVATVVLLGCRLARRSSAATRYAVAFAGLLTVAALPIVHFLVGPPSLREKTEVTEEASFLVVDDASARRLDALADDAAHEVPRVSPNTETPEEPALVPTPRALRRSPGHFRRYAESAMPAFDDAFDPPGHPSIAETAPGTPASSGGTGPRDTPEPPPFPVFGRRSGLVAAAVPPAFFEEPSSAPLAVTPPTPSLSSLLGGIERSFWNWPHAWRVPIPPRIAMAVVLVWMVLVALRLGGLAGQCLSLQRLVRTGEPAPEPIRREFERLARTMAIRRPVTLAVAPDLHSAVAIGFFRPAILIPGNLTQASPHTLSPLLRHELAHIRRYDDWTNLVQQAAKAVFFFHPGILALSRRLTLDREIACDDHVLTAAHAPRDYALFLTDFASRTQGRRWAAAPAAWSNPSQLQERIHMILDPKRNISSRVTPTRIGVLTLAAFLVAATGIGAAPRVALDLAATESTTPDLAGVTEDIDEYEATDDVTVLALSSSDDVTATSRGLSSSVELATTGEPSDDATPPKAKTKRSSGHAGATATVTTAGPSADSVGSAHSATATLRSADGHSVVIAIPPTPPVPPQHAPHPLPAPHATIAPAPVPALPAAPGHANPNKSRNLYRSLAVVAAPDDADRGLEERMRRLERLVDSLVRQKSLQDGKYAWEPKEPKEPKPGKEAKELRFEFYPKELDVKVPKINVETYLRFDDLTRELEQVGKDVERSLRDAERSARQALKSADLARERAAADQEGQKSEIQRKAVEMHRKIVGQQREALRRQIEAMQAQVERLEDQLDHLDDKVEEAAEAAAEAGVRVEKEVRKSEGKPARDHEESPRSENKDQKPAKVKAPSDEPSPENPPTPPSPGSR